jgi:hypothetical protein
MQINRIYINREDVTKENVATGNYTYDSIINNNTQKTSSFIVESAAIVLFDIYHTFKEESENELHTEP